MATNWPGFKDAMYEAYVEGYADEYAFVVAGHPLLKDFDREKYDAVRARFLERIDTPEKLMEIAEALTPPPCPECGR